MKTLQTLFTNLGSSRKWMAVVAYAVLAILGDQGVISPDTVDQIFYALAAIVGLEGAADIVSRAKGGNDSAGC